jgi:hypothetical protein
MIALYIPKRTFDRPWGEVFLRYGSTGNTEDYVDPDDNAPPTPTLTNPMTANRDGEVFVY